MIGWQRARGSEARHNHLHYDVASVLCAFLSALFQAFLCAILALMCVCVAVVGARVSDLSCVSHLVSVFTPDVGRHQYSTVLDGT